MIPLILTHTAGRHRFRSLCGCAGPRGAAAAERLFAPCSGAAAAIAGGGAAGASPERRRSRLTAFSGGSGLPLHQRHVVSRRRQDHRTQCASRRCACEQGQILARLDPSDAQQQASGCAGGSRCREASADVRAAAARSRPRPIRAEPDRRAQLEQTQDAYTAALDARDQAAAQQAVAQNNLQYNTLRADHDGFITSENADTGQVVAAGQAVYGLAWSGDTDVTIDAPEGRLGAIACGSAGRRDISGAAESTLRRTRAGGRPGRRSAKPYLPREAVVDSAGSRRPARHDGRGDAGQCRRAGASAVRAATAARCSWCRPPPSFIRAAQPAVWVVRPKDSTLELRPVTRQPLRRRDCDRDARDCRMAIRS